MKTEDVTHDMVKPGDRLMMSFGIVTVAGQYPFVAGGDMRTSHWYNRVRYNWVEDQPEVTLDRSQTVTRVIEGGGEAMRTGHKDREDDVITYHDTEESARREYADHYGKEYADAHPADVKLSKLRPGQYYVTYPK